MTTSIHHQTFTTHAPHLSDHQTVHHLFTLPIQTTLIFTQSQTASLAEYVCDHPLSRQTNSENYTTSIPIRLQSNAKPLRLVLECMLLFDCHLFISIQTRSFIRTGVTKVSQTGSKINAVLQKGGKKTEPSHFPPKPTIPMKLGTTLLFLLLPTSTTIRLFPYNQFILLPAMPLSPYAGLQVFLPQWKSVPLGDLPLTGVQLHMAFQQLSRVHAAHALNHTSLRH